MHLRALEQIGHGREPDMGMRPHVDALARREIRRAEIVEEHERADGAASGLRQDALDDEPVTQIVRIAFEDDHAALLSNSREHEVDSGDQSIPIDI